MYSFHTVSDSTLSTNATASNLVGPGRVLGLAIEKFGKIIEIRANTLAENHGYGPRETTLAIEDILNGRGRIQQVGKGIMCVHIPESEKDKALRKLCLRLVKYTR